MTGGCLCGRVRYRAGGEPFHATLCHCADCRRAAGAPAVGWFTVRPADLVFEGERPKAYASSPGRERGFCPHCGTQLTFRNVELDEVDVTICSLDQPETLPPADHTYTRSQLPWLRLADALPRIETTRVAAGRNG